MDQTHLINHRGGWGGGGYGYSEYFYSPNQPTFGRTHTGGGGGGMYALNNNANNIHWVQTGEGGPGIVMVAYESSEVDTSFNAEVLVVYVVAEEREMVVEEEVEEE